MYNVLLVDDEPIILEGISSIIDWGRHGTTLAGTARNGIEAARFIDEHEPDIVITDIRMPGMDGLQLIEKVKQERPGIAFILLSGFSEFEYARGAMRHGVAHYLVKPCNENAISSALEEIVRELDSQRARSAFMDRLQHECATMLPHAKEQLLKEMVTNKTYGPRDWDSFTRLFRIPLTLGKVRLVLFQLEGSFEYEHLFAVKNIAEDVLDSGTLLLGTTIGERVLLLVTEPPSEAELLEKVEKTREIFLGYYRIDMTISLSEAGDMTEARKLYHDTLECLAHRFYLGEGSLITSRDVVRSPRSAGIDLESEAERILLLVKAGRLQEVKAGIRQWFDTLSEARLDIAVTQSYVIPFYLSIIRLAVPGEVGAYMKRLTLLEKLDTLPALHELVDAAAEHITRHYYESNLKQHSAVIHKVLDIIQSNLGNPQLTLNWVAKEMLYMNADYLGKLFKKELGMKFSGYVVNLRLEAAVKLMNESDDIKVFEVADRLGYGDNPQYFSQVFKKYIGCAPSEYKRVPQMSGHEGGGTA